MSRRVKGFPWKGDRMRFLGRNGYETELARAMEVFEVGKEYEVRDCDVGEWSHHVAFVGIDGRYNGVMFALVAEPGTEPANRDEPTQDTTVVVPNQSYAALVAERDALRKALEETQIGVNHIATYRAADWPDYRLDGLTVGQLCESALRILGAGRDYDMWCCWSGTMRARDDLAAALAPETKPA